MKNLGAKIVSLAQFKKLRPKLKGKVVMTGGGFDPIHPGHVSLILESKRHGDILVVVINGDNFLRTKKGKPFQDLATRSLIVSGLRGVDYVVPFSEDTPRALIEAVSPNILVKGGDYEVHQIAGSEHVLAKGGQVKILPFVPGCSTTSMLERMNTPEAELEVIE